jgi:PAS domain-containing protein
MTTWRSPASSAGVPPGARQRAAVPPGGRRPALRGGRAHRPRRYIEQAPIGFALLDAELRCRRINARLTEMAGTPAERHVGRALTDVLPGAPPELPRALAEVVATGAPGRTCPSRSTRAPGAGTSSCRPTGCTWRTSARSGGLHRRRDHRSRRGRGGAALPARPLRDAPAGAVGHGRGVRPGRGARILYVNAAAERIARRSPGSSTSCARSWTCSRPLGTRSSGCAAAGSSSAGTPSSASRRSCCGPRRQRPDRAAAQPLEVDGRTRLVVVARDISERRRQQLERERLLDAEQRARRASPPPTPGRGCSPSSRRSWRGRWTCA